MNGDQGAPASDPNPRAWGNQSVAATYAAAHHGLYPVEVAALAEAWSRIRDKRVLDLGVGAGRTLPYLHQVASSYVGVDYSEAMVGACKARFPGADVRQGDARDLSAFGDGSFDFVLFSFNSIDYVQPEERVGVLREIHRVLAPGGAFAFSSHNLRHAPPIPSPFKLPEVKLSKDPFVLGARLVGAAREAAIGWQNHKRLAGKERKGDGWAFVNDGDQAYSLLVCYVDPTWQVAELERAGFGVVKVVDADGRIVPPSDATGEWPYFVAEKG